MPASPVGIDYTFSKHWGNYFHVPIDEYTHVHAK